MFLLLGWTIQASIGKPIWQWKTLIVGTKSIEARDLPLSRWIARGQTCSKMHIPLRSCWGGIWFQRKDRLQPYSRSYLPLGSNRNMNNMRTAHGPSVFFPGWACWAADKMLRAAPCICEFLGTPKKHVQQPQEWSIQFWFLAKLNPAEVVVSLAALPLRFLGAIIRGSAGMEH